MLVVQMASAIMTNPVDALIGLVMMRSLCWSSSQNLFSQNGSMTLSRRGGNSVLVDTLNMLCLFCYVWLYTLWVLTVSYEIVVLECRSMKFVCF